MAIPDPTTYARLRGLRDKYVEMERLRLADLDGSLPDPRPAMRGLAARFPGALREIDEIALDEIRARIAALDAALAGDGAPAPEWAVLSGAYHAWLRAALCIRSLGRGGADDEAALAVFRANFCAAPDDVSVDAVTLAIVAAVRRPSGGRLNPWAYARVAAEHGVAAEHVRAVLFPPRTRR
jgi:hypothetical protein